MLRTSVEIHVAALENQLLAETQEGSARRHELISNSISLRP